jgi:hypothetical protein
MSQHQVVGRLKMDGSTHLRIPYVPYVVRLYLAAWIDVRVPLKMLTVIEKLFVCDSSHNLR